jgi:DNA-binding transcriptional LysR family regulator
MSEAMSQARPSGTAVPVLEGFRLPIPLYVGWRRNERRQVARVVIELTLEFARDTQGSLVRSAPELLPTSSVRAVRRRKAGSTPVELEFRHLRALLEVAATQSIGRAAEQLGITQPALSRQLQELERSLGFALLHRASRGVSLTAGGTALASECPALLGSLERLTRETTRARRGMEGHCVIGAVTTVAASDLLGAVLSHCAVRHPQLSILIDEIPTPKQPAALRQGKIDMGLLHSSPAPDSGDHFQREQVYSDHIDVALLSPAHTLAERIEVTAADLAEVPFLFMARAFQPPLYDLVMSSLAAIGLVPLVNATYDGLPTVWTIAAQGWGWCLGFRSHIARPPAGTVAVRIKGLDIPWGLDIMWRKDERSAAVRAVVEAFRAARASEQAAERTGRPRRSRPSGAIARVAP